MILLIKKKGNYYRRFKLDIWGLSFCDENNSKENHHRSWILRFFLKIYKKKIEKWWQNKKRYIYRIDIIDIPKKIKKWNKRWLSIRLCRLYFLTLQDHQFRNIFKKASKLTGNLELNYCYYLECRTITIIYRTNFLANIFNCIMFIKRNRLFINNYPINYINAVIPVNSLIKPSEIWIPWIKYHLYKRIILKSILFNTPKFLFISFRFWLVFLLKKPKRNDLVYPISIDIQRISGYY
jgi:hypothetical protein